MDHGAFTTHLIEAIGVNQTRRPFYAQRTQGRSRRISAYLIGTERLLLPWARDFDRRALRFQRRSIPILEDDLFSMAGIRPVEAPPRFSRRADAVALERVRRRLRTLRDRLRQAVPVAAFEAAAEAALEALEAVEAWEETEAAHLAMSRHIIESIGLFSVNATRYRDASAGETVPLSKRYLRLQMFGLAGCVGLDVMAQRIHGYGVGIVVNDLPSIPFGLQGRS